MNIEGCHGGLASQVGCKNFARFRNTDASFRDFTHVYSSIYYFFRIFWLFTPSHHLNIQDIQIWPNSRQLIYLVNNLFACSSESAGKNFQIDGSYRFLALLHFSGLVLSDNWQGNALEKSRMLNIFSILILSHIDSYTRSLVLYAPLFWAVIENSVANRLYL